MSTEALTWAFNQSLPMSEKFVLVALADFADENGTCFPSHAKTAERVGASIDTVKRATRRLQERGCLEIIPWTRGNGSSTSNRYRLKVGVQSAPPVQIATHPGYAGAPPGGCTGAPPLTTSSNHQMNHHTERTADASAVRAELEGQTDVLEILKTEDVQEQDPFEKFWSAYPDKRNKKAAQKAYRAARKKHGAEDLLELLSRYLEARGRYEKAGEFVPRIPYASTWLNGERWTDYAEAPAPAASPVPTSWADRLSMANDAPRPHAATEKKGPPTSWADRL